MHFLDCKYVPSLISHFIDECVCSGDRVCMCVCMCFWTTLFSAYASQRLPKAIGFRLGPGQG